MIKLKIENELQGIILDNGVIRLPLKDEVDSTVYGLVCDIKPYDIDKWGDGKIHMFNTINELAGFIESCVIEFTDESEETYHQCDGYYISKTYRLNPNEENSIIFSISAERYYYN